MDQRTFSSRLATETGMSSKKVSTIAAALGEILQDILTQGDSAAIPGFGTFTTVKNQEYVETDPRSGVARLMPPAIHVEFTPGSQLKKAISKR